MAFWGAESNYLQCCRVLIIGPRLYDNRHILIESHKKSQQSLNGKLTEIATQHSGNVGLANPEPKRRLYLLHAAFFHQLVDLEDELGLHEMFLGVGESKVLKNIAAAQLIVFFTHPCISLAIPSASRSRLRIKSRFHCGVATPDLAFF